MRSFAMAAGVAGGVQTIALLRRLRAELGDSGRLSTSSVVWMYATYAAHAAATAVAVTRRSARLPLPRPVSLLGGAIAVAGTGLTVAGMSRFGPRQLSGTETGALVASGVYRYSRNPQYAGYVLQLTGLALARRSAVALGLATGAAAALRWWVPVEEHHLEREFGDRYRAYLEQAPRWLGAPATAARGNGLRAGRVAVMVIA